MGLDLGDQGEKRKSEDSLLGFLTEVASGLAEGAF